MDPSPVGYWSLTQFQKFCLGFLAFFLIGFLWHIFLFLDFAEHWPWAKHELTFLVVHCFLFAPACGLVFTIVDRSLLQELRLWKYGILVVFLLLVLGLCCVDFVRGSPNKLSPAVGFLETWIFMSAIAVFIWYSLMVIFDRDAATFVVCIRLLFAASLFTLWIPFRVYADVVARFAPHFNGAALKGAVAGGVGPQAQFALLVAFLFFTTFAIYGIATFTPTYLREVSAGTVAGATILASIALAANTGWVKHAYNVVEKLDDWMFLALGIVAFTMILVLAKGLFREVER